MINSSAFKTLVTLSLLSAGLWTSVAILGCSGGTIDPGTTDDYLIVGALVIDRNMTTDATQAIVWLAMDSVIVTSAQIKFGSSDLTLDSTTFPGDSLYLFQSNSTSAFPPGGHLLQVVDNTRLDRNITTIVINNSTITNVIPTNRMIQGNSAVSLEWNAIENVDSYVMAAVKENLVYSGVGFSLFSTTGNSGTIPPDAFLSSDGFTPDTGLYRLYVYGISDSPDSALASGVLPVPLPAQLQNNINNTNLKGRFGVVVVTLFDTVRVVQQQ